jgi:hypothetical protein
MDSPIALDSRDHSLSSPRYMATLSSRLPRTPPCFRFSCWGWFLCPSPSQRGQTASWSVHGACCVMPPSQQLVPLQDSMSPSHPSTARQLESPSPWGTLARSSRSWSPAYQGAWPDQRVLCTQLECIRSSPRTCPSIQDACHGRRIDAILAEIAAELPRKIRFRQDSRVAGGWTVEG